jgi:hypothetical protein
MGLMRRSRFRFCLSMRLQFFCRHFPKSFLRAFEIRGYLDRVRSGQGFFIRFSSCVSGTLSKISSIKLISSSPICGDYREFLLNYLL